MNFSLKTSFAAGLFAAVLGTANLAYGGVTKFVTTSAIADCEDVFVVVNGELDERNFNDDGVKAEIEFLGGEIFTGSTLSNGGETVIITSTSSNNKIFDWAADTTAFEVRGFDVVVVFAKEQVVYVYEPPAFSGASLADITTPIGTIMSVLFCSETPPPLNIPPVADFSVTANGLTPTFTDLSTDIDGFIVSRLWEFGDSQASTQKDPIHSYATAGTFQVTLTVTDDDGATDSVTQFVTVVGLPVPIGCLLDSAAYTNVCNGLNASDFVVANPSVAVVFSHTTVGNNYNSLCTCPAASLGTSEQFLCDGRPICNAVLGDSIVDCSADPGSGDFDDGNLFCKLESPTGDPCCGGLIATGPSGGVDSTPQAGSCTTQFTIGGIPFTVTFDFGPPCPTFQ